MKLSKQELFESASIPKAYFALTIPSVLGKVVMLLYNMADTWFIAATDDPSLVAGVSLCGPIFMLMLAMGDIFGMGGSSVISRLFGKGQIKEVGRISSFCFYGALLGGVLTTIILLGFQAPILMLLGADKDTLPYAAEYYRYIALGAPVIVASIVPLNLLRSEGMAKASMFGSALGSVVNIVLDPIFIFTFGMGAAGAAIATVLGNAASLVLYLYFINRKAQVLTVSPKLFTGKRSEIGPVFSIGIPASVNNLMQSFGIALCNRFLLLYGSDKIAAAGIASKISMISSMMIVGFAFGAAPLVGYTYGKGNREKLKSIVKFFYKFQFGMSAAVALVLGILSEPLIAAFMDDPAILSAGTEILRWQLIGMPFMSVVLVSACIFQASGKAKAALALSLSRQGVIYLIVIIAANALFRYNGVVAAQAVADLLSAGIAMVLFARGIGSELRGIENAN